jgi:hypothetical protein
MSVTPGWFAKQAGVSREYIAHLCRDGVSAVPNPAAVTGSSITTQRSVGSRDATQKGRPTDDSEKRSSPGYDGCAD